MVAKLDSLVRQKAQERFHPPASFEHSIAHGNALKYQNRPNSGSVSGSGSGSGFSSSSSSISRPPVGPDITYTRPVLSDTYDYQPSNFGSDDSKPSYVSSADYPPSDTDSKVRSLLKYFS